MSFIKMSCVQLRKFNDRLALEQKCITTFFTVPLSFFTDTVYMAGISSHSVSYTVAFKSVQREKYQTQAQLERNLNHKKPWFRSWI